MVMAKEMSKGKKNIVGNAVNSKTAFTRMLIMTAVDIIGICILLSIGQEAMVETAFVNHWLLPLTIVFGVLSAAAAVYQILVAVKKVNTSAQPVTPAMLLCIVLFCLFTCGLYRWVRAVFLAIASVIATVLFLVYYLYMHIFYR